MSKYTDIRPYEDQEVEQVVKELRDSEAMQSLLQFAFPQVSIEERDEMLLSCRKISDFQRKIMIPVIKTAINKSVTCLTNDGFEGLDDERSYLFISNHRDIILDNSFLNVTLNELGFKMTASAIGDNLVKRPFMLAFAKVNRNFLIQRGLPPKEMLESSKIVSKFINRSLNKKNRSVWIAQREGRTKNGDDKTQQGVLKMLSLNCPEEMSVMQYLKSLRIVPMSISYEFDPTDVLKIPFLLAEEKGEKYVKDSNEDFNTIVRGLLGQKGRVHLSVCKVLDKELDEIESMYPNQVNKQIRALTEIIDRSIYQDYRLWPSNYIAYDMINGVDKFKEEYSEKEYKQFERRVINRSEDGDISRQKYLEMYSNPVKNKLSIL